MTQLTAAESAHARQLRDEAPWVWLYEFEVPTDPKTRYRLTNYTSPIAYGSTSLGEPLTYEPFPIAHGDITKTLDGDLPQLQLQIGRPSAEISQILDDHSGLYGSPMIVRLVNVEALGSGSAALEFRAVVVGCRVTSSRATIVAGSSDWRDAVIPPLRFTPDRCAHAYGGAACGYDLSNPSLSVLPTCNRTFEACEVRGDLEVSIGIDGQHPQRFGGWRSTPRR